MSGGLRQSMSGLHTWGGLVFGWLLMAIFVAGTLCVFSEPITEWMKNAPEEAHTSLSPAQREQALDFAVQHLERAAAGAREWDIQLADSHIHLAWHGAADEEPHEAHHVHLDLFTGQEIPLEPAQEGRETTGGWNFVGFHYGLHAGMPGILLVGFVTVAMLVALVSGTIVHKRIFKDFFTLRLFKGQRSWLDGHNVASVLTLPFQLMIAYTGLVIFQGVWMPSSILFHYGMPGGLDAELQMTSPYWDAQREEGRRHQAQPAPLLPEDLPFAALPALVRQATERSGLPVGWVERQPNDADTPDGPRLWIGMAQPETEALVQPAPVAFRVVGDPPQLQQVERHAYSKAEGTRGVLATLHEAHFGGWTVKWLWFLCGAVGCVMIATGLVLFTVKRRQRSGHEFGAATPRVYRLIEAFNVASVAGICVASIAYFWANRIIPLDAARRPELEILCFLLVWAATPLHALLRPGRRAWMEQLGLAALLCLALPLLNLATTGDWLGSYAGRGHWQMFGVEAAVLALGALFALTAWQLARKQP